MNTYFLGIMFMFLLPGQLCISAQQSYFPPTSSDQWAPLSPDSLNWCSTAIDTLLDYLEESNTKVFIVLKNGKIALEHYFQGFNADSLWVWFSAGKSLTATLIGIAQQENYLNINDKTSNYLGKGWSACPSEKEELITIKHQLTMTSGLKEWIDFNSTDSSDLQYYTDAGSRWAYHNGPNSLLRNVLEAATGQNLNLYTYQKLKQFIGMDGFWLKVDDNNFYFSTARTMARFGLLILNKGVWDKTPILSDTTYWHEMLNTSQALNQAYGYLWWLNGKDSGSMLIRVGGIVL